MKNNLNYWLIFLCFYQVTAQNFSRKDSLQGGLPIERTCFNVLHYGLDITVDIDKKYVSGNNEIDFKVVQNTQKIQLDLYSNMQVDSIVYNSKKLEYKREFNAVFIYFPAVLLQKSLQKVKFYYSGNPTIAKNAPWDGGFVFKTDASGKPWVGVACQGDGASMWYPCKDSQSDEPDNGATIKVAVPNGLMNVSNGRFMGYVDLKNGYTRWDWQVANTINSYDITLNIADYIHFSENYKGLDLDYYVLKENSDKAKSQFEQVKPMLDCFQTKFGIYPFANDGYKLVETNYLGMEHQSAVAYGNKYKNGYLGRDLSGTGIGLRFDFIIVHESGHEWFGNSITAKDIADMWIHEGFTCYSESVFLECQYGYNDAQIYINGLKQNIENDVPIIGPYGVNTEGSSDMYYKGALMLNTFRSVIADDQKWWKLLLDYSLKFKHQIIQTNDVISFFNKESKINLTPIFNQYLRYKELPSLEIRNIKNQVQFRWNANEPNFNMPVDIIFKNKKIRIFPKSKWAKNNLKIQKADDIEVLTQQFLITVSKL